MIASRYNQQFKELKSLLEPKGARKTGLALVSGRKIVPELMKQAVKVVMEKDEWPKDLAIVNGVTWIDRTLFKELDIFGTHYPLLVCEIPEMKAWAPSEPVQGLELLLGLQDPANLGACLRSAEAFGVSRIVLLKECAFPFHPKAIRSSSGSCFRIPLTLGPSVKELSDVEFALDMDGTPLPDFSWPANGRLLIGEEGKGLPENLKVQRLSIPMRPGLDSLNATIAASIALFSYRSQHK